MIAQLYTHSDRKEKLELFSDDIRTAHQPSDASKRRKDTGLYGEDGSIAMPSRPKRTINIWGDVDDDEFDNSNDWCYNDPGDLGLDADELLAAAQLVF
tara:strand:+ start:520 stop:813 length:294 start_codon:yes stop_codon:yes gene_type:complete